MLLSGVIASNIRLSNYNVTVRQRCHALLQTTLTTIFYKLARCKVIMINSMTSLQVHLEICACIAWLANKNSLLEMGADCEICQYRYLWCWCSEANDYSRLCGFSPEKTRFSQRNPPLWRRIPPIAGNSPTYRPLHQTGVPHLKGNKYHRRECLNRIAWTKWRHSSRKISPFSKWTSTFIIELFVCISEKLSLKNYVCSNQIIRATTNTRCKFCAWIYPYQRQPKEYPCESTLRISCWKSILLGISKVVGHGASKLADKLLNNSTGHR